jgi:hypothetical protein
MGNDCIDGNRAADVGRRVLLCLDAGRNKAIAKAKRRAAGHAALIIDLAAIDARAGRPERGRAGRIARKLRGMLSESQVHRILRALSSVRDFPVSNLEDEVHKSITTHAHERAA